jgi:hypothetical protein
MFRSRDGGQTFTGPVEMLGDADQTVPANLMVRAVVELGRAADATHSVVASMSEVDLGEGGTEQFDCGVRSPGNNGSYQLSAQFDPPAPGMTVTLSRQDVAAGEKATVTVTSAGVSEVTTAQLVISATIGNQSARTTVPIYVWREIARADIGPAGGSVGAQGLSFVVPKDGFDQTRTLRLFTGKPATGMDSSMASPAFRIDGFPDKYANGLQIQWEKGSPAAGTAGAAIQRSSRGRAAEADPGGAAVIRFALPDGAGNTIPVDQFQPTTVKGNSVILTIPPGKQPLTRRFSLWMLNGWLNLVSEHGNFLIFYDVLHRETAEWLAGQLEGALLSMTSSDVDISLLDRITYVETARLLGFAVHPIRATLRELDVPARTRGGQINFNMKRMEDPVMRVEDRATPGHELMHIAQSLYGDSQGLVDSFMRADPAVWADEAMAVWFERFAIKEPNHIPPSMNEHLRDFVRVGPMLVPEDTARDYGYGASTFLTYLHRVLDPALMHRWIAERSSERSAWATLIPLIGGDNVLQQRWRYYAEAMMNHTLLPNAEFPNPAHLMPVEAAFEFDMLKDYDYDIKHWNSARDLSMEFYKFSFYSVNHSGKRFDDLTDTAALGFRVLEDFEDVDLYVMDAKGKLLGTQMGKGELVLEDAPAIAASSPYLLVTVVNAGYDPSPTTSSKRDISVRMGLAEPGMKITGGNFVGDRVIGYSYDFGTKNVNIPKDASYSWDFGDGQTSTVRDVKHAWKKEGTYLVKVQVDLGLGKRLSDQVTVKVAPDTGTKKADVLFEVYRLFKSPVGSSIQKCNEYYITVNRPQGGTAISGDSIAKNGAFEATLDVADGYSYAIRYNYTGACPGYGNITGKFDVKANIINYVKVETPRCETN